MQGRQTQSYKGNYKAGNATRTWVMRYMGNSTANQSKVIQCYNCKGDDHIARHPNNAIFQTDGIDSFDSDCDEVPATQASFMDNLFDYGSDVLSK
ncbi:hypothetical protein Tco_0668059 [Tanacetum coccineum]